MARRLVIRRKSTSVGIRFLLVGLGLMAPQGWAGDAPPSHPDDCLTAAAIHHQVSPYILRAIAWQESRLDPEAVNHNKNGSVDYGALQINSIHLKRLAPFGIDATRLMDACVSAYVGAWLLREQFERYGNTWRAVGAYHSRTPVLNARYAAGVRRTLERWNARVDLD